MTSSNRRRVIAQPVLSKNQQIAAANRALFKEHGLYALNLIGSPGAGKTTILEQTLARLGLKVGIVQGDIQTSLDADRVRKAGAEAVQIETGGACHLDAAMVAVALEELPLDRVDLLIIENVGNLICPTGYDLGEDEKVAVLSVAEGDEKVAKYPSIFIRAGVVLINKIDLLPYTNFSMERAMGDLSRLHAGTTVFPLSGRTGEGLEPWCDYLRRKAKRV
jgi:hydrogenase nickel incorporation protein HypB